MTTPSTMRGNEDQCDFKSICVDQFRPVLLQRRQGNSLRKDVVLLAGFLIIRFFKHVDSKKVTRSRKQLHFG
ncbi:MAG: hypothetical protein AAGB06_04125 [Verrucomicrobiota bacterium]